MLANEKAANRYSLSEIYQNYVLYCFTVGAEPASYERWKLLTDSNYKLAGITNK